MSVSVCLYVCLLACMYVRNDTRQNFDTFSVHATNGSGSAVHWRHFDKFCISGFVNDASFARNDQEQATRKRHILKVTQQGAALDRGGA